MVVLKGIKIFSCISEHKLDLRIEIFSSLLNVFRSYVTSKYFYSITYTGQFMLVFSTAFRYLGNSKLYSPVTTL
jgi:hypothetical protein